MHPHMQHYLFMHLWTHFRSAHVLHPYTEVFFLVSLHLCLHSACRVSTWFPDCGKLQSEQSGDKVKVQSDPDPLDHPPDPTRLHAGSQLRTHLSSPLLILYKELALVFFYVLGGKAATLKAVQK